MSRSRTDVVVASLAALLSSSACTLVDGQPWGMADLSLRAGLPLDNSRTDEDGAWITADDWAVAVDTLVPVLSALRLVVSEDGAGAATFDPANPPDGYSLCHGGHCHADDGRLVDFDEIRAELAAGTSGGGFALTRAVEGEVDVGDGFVDVPLSACVPDCTLPPGRLARVEVEILGVRLTGTVRDRRAGDNQRLADVHEVALEVPVDAVVGAALAGNIGRYDPIGVRVAATLALTPRLLDGVDFAAVVAGDPTAGATLRDTIADSSLQANVVRFTPDKENP